MQKLEMVEEVRERLGERAEDFYLDTQILRYLNWAARKYCDEEKWPWLYTVEQNIPIASGQTEVELIDDVDFNRHFNFVLTTSGDTQLYIPRRISPKQGLDIRASGDLPDSGYPKYFYAFRSVVNTVSALNEVVTLTEGTNMTVGTFTLTFGGQTTGALQWNASAGTIETALLGLSSIGTGNVTVSGGPISTTPAVITFTGTLAGENVGTITSDQTSLTGTFGIVVTTQGRPESGKNLAQVVRLVPVPDRTFTAEMHFFRTMNLLVDDEDELDMPKAGQHAVIAYATAMIWLKEFDGRAKSDEQFSLYGDLLATARKELKQQPIDTVVVWGREGHESSNALFNFLLPDNV